MGVRIRDVAARAGVSTATVSRVLSGVDPVSAALTERVWQAVRELGYHPNRVARRLRRPGKETWALIVPDVSNRFFTSIARGVEDVASDAGVTVFIGNTDGNPNRLARYLETAISEQVAGIILAPSTPYDDVADALDAQVPLVAVDQVLTGRDLPTVMTDHFEGGRLAAQSLRESGASKIAVIAGPQDEPAWNTRIDGLRAALPDGAVVAVERGRNHAASGRDAMERLLDGDVEFDGLFVTNNLMTIGALRAAMARGIRIPEDLGVVGYDLKSEEWVSEIPVTSINQSPITIGQVAARRLLGASTGEKDLGGVEYLTPELGTAAALV
ncbi:LacI family DNA-binding transcriptional regulator [Microbacterium sp. XT11]|uniref:LacI family DNA-binding transcriptional regulator n=1 Tax=Microbacterium sp. XT11 TaxID=367477 RepID=UPI000742DD19|nr:LacI family DNA-binding transcriptional regulator [Microbacterium sp. XT11]ALX65914.1 hypothetical protein AB663_000713 [Microbacterium sp. XT11]